MNIKVNFISKLSKAKTVNEIVFVKGKKIKNSVLSSILKSVLDNQLFHIHQIRICYYLTTHFHQISPGLLI